MPNDIQFLIPVRWDLNLIFPQIILLAFILGILILNAVFGEEETRSTAVIAGIGMLMAGLFSKGINILNHLHPSLHFQDLWNVNQYAFNHMLLVDNYSLFFNLIFVIAGVLAVLSSIRYIEREGMAYGEYYVVLLGAVLGMMIMASAGNLLIVFLGIELLSISLYILAGFNRAKPVSGEAAIKYLLLGAFSTGFLLYGIAIIYGVTGSTDLFAIASHLKHNGAGPLMVLGAVFLIVGFSFKASLVPFHMWAPDVYQGAPTPITGFMSTAAKAAAFAVFFRVLSIALPAMRLHWEPLLTIIAILTITVGNILAVNQVNIKRMLAYSSITHAGYLLIAVLAAGRGEALGAQSIGFYLLAYTFMNMGAFGILSALARKDQDNETLDSLSGLGYRRPLYAAAMAICMLSLAGIPPTAGFLGKFYIFAAGFRAGLLPLVIVGVLNAVISVYYYLRVIVFMYMKEPEGEIERDPVCWWPAALAVFIAISGIILMGLLPSRFIYVAVNAILTGI